MKYDIILKISYIIYFIHHEQFDKERKPVKAKQKRI